MTSRKLRKLRLGSDLVLWRVRHVHEFPAPDDRRCLEVFSAYLEGFKRAPLLIRFPPAELQGSGFPLQRGVIVDSHSPTWSMNLNEPAAARLLVELGRLEGWSPPQRLEIPDGFALLRAHRPELEAFLSSRAFPPGETRVAPSRRAAAGHEDSSSSAVSADSAETTAAGAPPPEPPRARNAV